jgi:hypothetical protein
MARVVRTNSGPVDIDKLKATVEENESSNQLWRRVTIDDAFAANVYQFWNGIGARRKEKARAVRGPNYVGY